MKATVTHSLDVEVLTALNQFVEGKKASRSSVIQTAVQSFLGKEKGTEAIQPRVRIIEKNRGPTTRPLSRR